MRGSYAYIVAFNSLIDNKGRLLAEAKTDWAVNYEGVAELVVRTSMYYQETSDTAWDWACLYAVDFLDAMTSDLATKAAVDDFRYGRDSIARAVLGDVKGADAYLAVQAAIAAEEG
jgi:hypothetical protein